MDCINDDTVSIKSTGSKKKKKKKRKKGEIPKQKKKPLPPPPPLLPPLPPPPLLPHLPRHPPPRASEGDRYYEDIDRHRVCIRDTQDNSNRRKKPSAAVPNMYNVLSYK